MNETNLYPLTNKTLLTILCVMFLVSLGASHEQNTNYSLVVSSNNATQCNLSYIKYPDDNLTYFNTEMQENNKDFNITIESTNFSDLGEVCMGISCTDGVTTEKGSKCEFVTWNGEEEKDMTLILAEIFLIIVILLIVLVLHYNYKKVDYSESNKSISESHNGNWGRTFIRTLGNNLMRNSFLWYYSLGWLALIVMSDLVYRFSTSEIYSYFVLSLDIYSFGFFLVLVVWISVLIHHFRFITDLINDLNLGVER